MEFCLHDIIRDWCYGRSPYLLDDEEAFYSLVRLVQNLLVELERSERAGVYERMTKVSLS